MVAVTRLHVSIATFGLENCMGWPWSLPGFKLQIVPGGSKNFEQRGLLQSLLHWGLTLFSGRDGGSPVSAFTIVLVK